MNTCLHGSYTCTHHGVIGRIMTQHSHRGYYWPTVTVDFFHHANGFEAYKLHSLIPKALSKLLHHVIKPFPIKKYVKDLIGNIYSFIQEAYFITTSTEYFTNLVEAHSKINVKENKIINFIFHQVIYRLGFSLNKITINQETMLTSNHVVDSM